MSEIADCKQWRHRINPGGLLDGRSGSAVLGLLTSVRHVKSVPVVPGGRQ